MSDFKVGDKVRFRSPQLTPRGLNYYTGRRPSGAMSSVVAHYGVSQVSEDCGAISLVDRDGEYAPDRFEKVS